MRVPSLLPLLTVAALAGCATESPQPSSHESAFRGAGAADLARDLTLQAGAMPAVEVASPVELSRPAPETPRRASTSRKPVAAPAPAPVPEAPPAELPAPAFSEAVAVVTMEAPAEEVALGAGQELAPGKTVTVIPASSGPSSAPAEPSWVPTGPSRSVIIEGGGGGGGKCRPRGGARGIGIAGRIPHGVPGLRLR
ncbi:MAG: hypothetical protein H0X69_02240 [Gemmatimonadales bacterium]|nr:hypothetical protein [Gemmatimonadales bacterium]